MNEVQRQRRAMEQFDRLGDLDGDAQAAALAILRDEDPALAALVEAMLRVDAQAPVEPADGILHEALLRRIDDDALRAGQPIGPFVLVRALGRGGMGEVWEAVRAEAGFAQRVALKRLHAPASSPVARRRFLRERSILARLEHPAIARLIDGGIEPDGEAWLALEYVEGEPITEWVRRARPPRAARVTLVEDVCAAVAYAHGRLVLHRDIKPANVLVDDGGRVRLLDFGIARLLDDADGEDTSAGWVPRTPGYAAPEQLRGEPVGTAADVYQLGVLLGEVLFDARLREVNLGDWDGKRWDEVMRSDSARYEHWSANWVIQEAPGGESFADVIRRTGAWLASVLSSTRDEDTVLAVAHAGSIRALLCHALGLPAQRAYALRIDHAHAACIRTRAGQFEVSYVNSTRFESE